jgi:hypothetical protein
MHFLRLTQVENFPPLFTVIFLQSPNTKVLNLLRKGRKRKKIAREKEVRKKKKETKGKAERKAVI